MKCIDLVLFNDRETLVNMEDFLYATRVTVEETGEDVTKITFGNGKEIDVLDKVHEVRDKLDRANEYVTVK